MNIPFFESLAPDFKIPTQPELERAFNILSGVINKNHSQLPRFTSSGDGVFVNTDGENVVFSLAERAGTTKRGKFHVFYDPELSRLYVGEGRVQMLSGETVESMTPKIKGNRIAEFDSVGYDANKCSGDPHGVFFVDADYFEKTEIYVKIDNGDCEIYLRDVTQETPPPAPLSEDFPNSTFALIATLKVEDEEVKIEQKWGSDIFIVRQPCPFEVSDATEEGKQLTLRVATSRVRVDNEAGEYAYPTGMKFGEKFLLKIPEEYTKWFAVYIRYKFDLSNRMVGSEADSIEIILSETFLTNTYEYQYEVLAMVSLSYNDSSQLYVSDIQNNCWNPIPDFSKLLTYCTFRVTDVSAVDDNGVLKSKIRIQTDSIEGVTPNGMVYDEEKPYEIVLEPELLTSERAYVYLKVMVAENNLIGNYDKAVSIEVSRFIKQSGSFIQWTLLAEIKLGGDSDYRYIQSVDSKCPYPYVERIKDCPFEVEDATDSSEVVKVQIARGKVHGRYPVGMEEDDTVFQLNVPESGDWFAIYVVAELDSEGKLSQEANSLTIGIYDEYKQSDGATQYRILSEINVSERDAEFDPNTSRYISFIKNHCSEVIVEKEDGCPFELYDASDYDEDGNALNAKVFVSSTSVFDGKYASGMTPDGSYVVAITEEDTKVGDVVPSIGICYIYLKVLVDEYGVVQNYQTAITIEKTSRWYPDRGCSVQRFLIGSVQVENDGGSKFLSLASTCPIVSLNRDSCCPFTVEDSSDEAGLKVQIRTGTVDGKYPAGMDERSVYVLELPREESFHLIYCVSVLTIDGYLYPNREDGDDYVSFAIEKDYVTNTENLQYDLIAIVNTNDFEIVSIQNSCYEPVFKKPDPCVFALYDASDYENTGSEEVPKWEPKNCKVYVTQSSIRGIYPTGMSGDVDADPYVLEFDGSDFANWGDAEVERCYVYLLVLVDDTGNIYPEENSVTIEKSPFWYETDDSTYQRLLIGWVDAESGNGPSSPASIVAVHSECPDLALKRPADCPFKIEDASDLDKDGAKRVVIRNGKINGRYPSGMDWNTIYEISLPDKVAGEYYVYAVISIDQNGMAVDGEDGGPEISFSIEKEYQQNTSTEYYAIIGTIYLNDDGQLSIKSYCLDPSLPDRNVCPFELYDASDYDEDGNSTNAKVLVSNYAVFGNRYADGMDSDSSFVVTINPEDTKVGNITPTSGTCYIYLEVLLNEYGEVLNYDTAITIRKSSAWYGDRGCSTQRFLIGAVYVNNEQSNSLFSSVSSMCPIISINRDSCCPFKVEDVSDEDGLKVQIRTGTISGKYPAGMAELERYVLNLPNNENFHLIYCVSVLTKDGYLYPDREDGDDYISFAIEKDYVANTESLQYDLIGIVNTNDFEIVSIESSCYEPLYKQRPSCDFGLYDASDYENKGTEENPKWESTNCKVLITPSSIRGVYPTGMNGDPKAPAYILNFTTADFTEWETSDEIQRSYVYLKVLVNDDDEIYTGNDSVTIETSPFWTRNDYHTYQRILIGYVEAIVGSGGSPKILKVESMCPDLILNKRTDCLFKIEDGSGLSKTGPKEIMITNGKINDRYPSGMSWNTIYNLTVPVSGQGSTDDIFYVYAVISIDEYGRALDGSDGGSEISFEIQKEYKYNTADTYYAILGTVELDENKQLLITSYCVDPSVESSVDSCNFKTTDASTWSNNSQAPTTIAVRIQNSRIDKVYPDGMGKDTDFVLDLDPSVDFDESGICYIYAKAVLNPSGKIPNTNGAANDGALTIEKVSKFQTNGNYIQHIPIAQVFISPVGGGNGKEIVKITNFCPSGQLNEINTCAFYTEDVTDYSNTQNTKLSVLIANRNVNGALPTNMSATTCFVWEFDVDPNVGVYYVCCRIATGLYGVMEDDAEVRISVEKQEPKSTSYHQWFVLATVYVDIANNYIWDIQNYCYVPEAKARDCFFEVTDASSYDQNFNPTGALKVEVDQWSLPNTESSQNQNGIFPAGMGNNNRYILELPSEGEWFGVFVNILVNQENKIRAVSNSVTLSVESYMSEGTSTYQKFYVAGINVYEDDNGNRQISYIDNQCAYVAVRPPPLCPFIVEDASDSDNCKIQIRSGRINNQWPTNMNGTNTYTLTVSDEQTWWVVYCGMVVSDGVIQTGQGQVTFYTSDKYLSNTDGFVNFKIAEIQTYVDGENNRYVGWVDNVCAVPFVSSGASLPCPFKVVDVSEEDTLKVSIGWGLIWNMLPVGMHPDDNPRLVMNISQTSFIYSQITFDTSSLIPTDVRFNIFTELKTNTSSVQYNLIAVVKVEEKAVGGGTKSVITSIKNICVQPFPSPCSLM